MLDNISIYYKYIIDITILLANSNTNIGDVKTYNNNS